MALRLASSKTKRIEIGEGDYIDVVEDISRRQFSDLLKAMPSDLENISIEGAEEFTLALFNLFVKGWSVVYEDGEPVPVTDDNYFALSRDAAVSIDAAIIEYFNSLTPTPQEQSKSKNDSRKQRAAV